MPESIAWLLNIRGGDVPHTPLPLSFAILRDDGSVAAVHRPPQARARPRPPSRQRGQRSSRPASSARRSTRWPCRARGCRPTRRPPRRGCSTGSRRPARNIHRAADPCLLPKACKNPVELDGTRAAHRRDGAAVTRFLAWLAREAPKGGLARDRRQRPARSLPPRGRAFPRPELPDDLGRRLERRDRALPRRRRRPRRRSSRARSICSIPARNISTARPTSRARSRSARRRRDARPLHARAEGPYRARDGALPERHDRHAARRARAARAVAGGLDYDHGTGHGVGSYLSCTRGRSASRRRRTRSRCCRA